MPQSKLIALRYSDPVKKIMLLTYADTVMLDNSKGGHIIGAIRFGGYPEMVQAMSDAIYGGASIDASQNKNTVFLQGKAKSYRRQISHDGVYAVATMILTDELQETAGEESDNSAQQAKGQTVIEPRKCYIFCPSGDRERLFEELDAKTAVPLIPEFRNYVLDALMARKQLRPMEILARRESLDAWVLDLYPEDSNLVEILEEGLRTGRIAIPGAVPEQPDGFDGVSNVTSYLNTFGVTVADRIRNQFSPLFDPASEPLSNEVLAINDYVQKKAGYSLYDAQLAVAEATKRQLDLKSTALIIAECGSGKTKIGATALGALHGLWAASQKKSEGKSFGVVLCPSHVSGKWVREISETLPDTYGMVVRSITDLNRLWNLYEKGDKSVYAVISKERARDGYMRYPAVLWSRRKKSFVCPDCMETIEMDVSSDGVRYVVPADQFFFQTETRHNHICPRCGAALWAPVNPGRKIPWVKIGEYGWVYRYGAKAHLNRTKNEKVIDQLMNIAKKPDGCFPTRGACRRYPLSSYIKKRMRGKVSSFLADELHEYNNASGQGDAMAEIFSVSKLFVGMTATLINGYSSGIFHLLYRIVPGLMQKDGKPYKKASLFDAEYGVVENIYEITDANYNSNRRSVKRKTKTRQLPGVSPLVFSRFLLEYTCFLSLTDMGKNLPDYEEIPVPLDMPQDVETAYKKVEKELQRVLRSDRCVAQKILSSYLGLLTVYPDQPYDQPEIIDPFSGTAIVTPENHGDFSRVFPKEEKALEIVRAKLAAGERVLIYTSWTRTDSQKKLLHLLRAEGIQTEVLTPEIPPEKREAWVEKRLAKGLQVLITNPRCVETGLDLNAFTTLIFYSLGYNLFTLRQASRRSWRINQTAPRVEVYLLYYADTMQAKAMKLMASKLAVAGIIEGTLSEEGLAAMSDVKDLTSQMAKELALGIRDNVEDIAASFKRMAIINPRREERKKPDANVAETTPVLSAGEESTRTVDRISRQALYDGLLERTGQEQKKRKAKKSQIDENQLSIFDFVA